MAPPPRHDEDRLVGELQDVTGEGAHVRLPGGEPRGLADDDQVGVPVTGCVEDGGPTVPLTPLGVDRNALVLGREDTRASTEAT